MNILFLSLIDFKSIYQKGIYTDLLAEFVQMGHSVYAVSPFEKRKGGIEEVIRENDKVSILKVMIGNTQKTNLIEKGISTITIEPILIRAIDRYFSDVEFGLVLYSTPPITFERVVRHIKRKNENAISYLMLKDIFPQNAVDLGMLSKESPMYQYFRWKEKRLYEVSDYIGCMSPKNCRYLLRHNPQIRKSQVEVCPNSIRLGAGEMGRKSASERRMKGAALNAREAIEKGAQAEGTAINVKKMVEKAEFESLRKRLREVYGLPLDRPVLLYGGNLGKPQDIPFIIRCLKENQGKNDRFFLICGSGTEFEPLNDYYRTVKDREDCNFKLFRELPKDEYEQLSKTCDAGLIFLDHRFTIPNFPSRLLSYMEAGIPVLAATDANTDIKDVILRGHMGAWCESVRTSDFTKMVDEVLVNPEQMEMMGKNARRFLENHFTTEKTAEKIMGKIMILNYMLKTKEN